MSIQAYLTTIEQFNYLPMCPSKEWIFHPGMLFGSPLKWWSKEGDRATCHEGLDIAMYRNSDGRIISFDPDIQVPAMMGGTILNICHDFLGKSVIVSVQNKDNDPEKDMDSNKIDPGYGALGNAIIYSHIHPDASLKPGRSVEIGQFLGCVADTSMKKSGIGCHLHISFIEISTPISAHSLDWGLFVRKDQASIQFYNPLYITMPNPLNAVL